MTGPAGILRTSSRVHKRRRLKLRRHDVKGKSERIYFCVSCRVYTHNLSTHKCGKRQR